MCGGAAEEDWKPMRRTYHVELAGGEFRVMGHVNAFVTELTADLVDTVQASNNKHLEVQLGCDTHEQGHLELVVVGLERTGGGTACLHGHHWRLNLKEAAAITTKRPRDTGGKR